MPLWSIQLYRPTLKILNKPVNQAICYVSAGMPPLDLNGRKTSFFEFWPLWLIYLPVFLQWLLLSLRYRSFSLPLIANPAVPLSGMVGVAKSSVFDAAGNEARQWILPWYVYEVSGEALEVQTQKVLAALSNYKLSLPIVGKPEIGCRGVGVKLLKNEEELANYLANIPTGGSIQFQKLSQWDAEAGVFYIRYPGSSSGEVTSVTLKYTPYVVGDGHSTLSELIEADPRAGVLQHLYNERHQQNWHTVIAAGEPFRLIFAASHSRGAVFRDGKELITAKLSQSLDKIFNDIPGYYYGRLDIKFQDVENLKDGRNYDILEINGASSESINIWDRNASFFSAIRTLLQQYHTLFKIGNENRQRGYKTPGLFALYKAWRFETKLVKLYPDND